jgi:hypothetical protein
MCKKPHEDFLGNVFHLVIPSQIVVDYVEDEFLMPPYEFFRSSLVSLKGLDYQAAV